jgi:hypothetical protein
MADDSTIAKPFEKVDLKGKTPESWACIDCNINTHPGSLSRVQLEQAYAFAKVTHSDKVATITFGENTEVYMVKDAIWKAAGMNAGQGGFGDQDGDSGCLCIGCLEKRIGRDLVPKDFLRDHPFNSLPGTERLLARRGGEWMPPR